MVGKDGNDKDLYEYGIQLLINEDGEAREWENRVQQYAEENDVDEAEVLNKVITAAIDSDGEPDLKFKEISGL